MPIKRKEYPSQEQLHRILEYYPETGLFMWRPKIGDIRPILMWNANCAGKLALGYPDRYGHIQLTIKKKKYSAHRLAWIHFYGDDLPNEIDHINGIRNDNRISSLREATRSQNNGNRKTKIRKHDLPKGVELLPMGRYTARICCNKKRIYIGSFDTIEEAQKAYMEKAKKLFGEFAHTGER